MKKKKQRRKKYEEIESDGYFAYIAGYTSSGFAYGVTHEELEEMLEDEEQYYESKNDKKIKNSDLPF